MIWTTPLVRKDNLLFGRVVMKGRTWRVLCHFRPRYMRYELFPATSGPRYAVALGPLRSADKQVHVDVERWILDHFRNDLEKLAALGQQEET